MIVAVAETLFDESLVLDILAVDVIVDVASMLFVDVDVAPTVIVDVANSLSDTEDVMVVLAVAVSVGVATSVRVDVASSVRVAESPSVMVADRVMRRDADAVTSDDACRDGLLVRLQSTLFTFGTSDLTVMAMPLATLLMYVW